jgi:hypothetical protein
MLTSWRLWRSCIIVLDIALVWIDMYSVTLGEDIPQILGALMFGECWLVMSLGGLWYYLFYCFVVWGWDFCVCVVDAFIFREIRLN